MSAPALPTPEQLRKDAKDSRAEAEDSLRGAKALAEAAALKADLLKLLDELKDGAEALAKFAFDGLSQILREHKEEIVAIALAYVLGGKKK